MSLNLLQHNVNEVSPYLPERGVALSMERLTEAEHAEVVAFLAERPIHTVLMAGLIRDNGLMSEHNRGTFYGCRNSEGRLEGIALIGHATLIEARTSRAIRECALMAQAHSGKHMILGEHERVEEFWNHYADEGQEMRLICRELLFVLRHTVKLRGEVKGLRRATTEDLDLIAPVHAAMAEEESGVNPLETDREGFLARCARRIEKGRVWVVVEDNRLLFKADIQADTSEVIYLEGVWVDPRERGTGLGRKCLTQLCRDFLARSKSVSLLVNEENDTAHIFYRMCNFKLRSVYDTIYLERCNQVVS